MIKNLYIKNHFQKKYFKRKNLNKFSIKFKKEIFNIYKEIEDPKKTINVLSKTELLLFAILSLYDLLVFNKRGDIFLVSRFL